MAFTPAAPVVVAPATTGFSMSLQYTSRSSQVRITISEAAQKEHFGGSLEGKHLDLMIGRDADRGRIKLALADEGAFKVTTSARGSVFIKANAWNLLPKDKRPSQQLQVAFSDATGLTLIVPDFDRVAPKENTKPRSGKHPMAMD